MSFTHDDEETELYGIGYDNSEVPLAFIADCEDCLFEAWERMTYGGVTAQYIIKSSKNPIAIQACIEGRHYYVAR